MYASGVRSGAGPQVGGKNTSGEGQGPGHGGGEGVHIRMLLSSPDNIAFDSVGNLYFTDTNNCVVHKVTPVTAGGIITTVAGATTTVDGVTTPGTPLSTCGSTSGNYSGDGGLATSAALDNPTGIAVDWSSNIYVDDERNHRTRVFVEFKWTPTVSAWPTASPITYGQTLASSTLTGGTALVAGSFAWTTPTTVPGAGTASQSATFTPTDTANINTVTATVSLTVSALTQSTSGNVGVGTTSPIATLQVGNGSTSAAQALYVDSNLNGNTVSALGPGAWIEWNGISGTGDAAAGMTDFVNNEGGGTGGWQFINTNAGGTPINPPAMVIQGTSGSVGIGNAAPAFKLDVAGQINSSVGLSVNGTSVINASGALGWP